MTKSSHFLPVRINLSAEDYERFFFYEIVKLYWLPVSIISDRGTYFSSHFCRSFQKASRTKVSLSIAFYPQTDGQVDRTI